MRIFRSGTKYKKLALAYENTVTSRKIRDDFYVSGRVMQTIVLV
jgi:hypothetical protein